MISDLMRRIASSDRYQIAVQYPGKSVDSRWENGEIIVSSKVNGRGPVSAIVASVVTVFAFSSGDSELDQIVCKKMLDVNKDIRLILVLTSQFRNSDSELAFDSRFLAIRQEAHLKDTVFTLLRFSEVLDFSSSDHLASAFKDRMNQIGFKDLESQSQNVVQFVATAAQSKDKEVKQIAASWTANVFKTIYPVLRDLSDFRGIILQGRLFDSDFIAYKESGLNSVSNDLERVSSLIQTFKSLK